MKKIIALFSLCLCVGMTAMAQEVVVIDESSETSAAYVNKRGIPLLPKAGDFAFGVDATPFLQYFGNFFNGAGSNAAPVFNGVNNTIYGKYFLEDNRAIRAKLRLNVYRDEFKGTVKDNTETSDNPLNPYATVVDVEKVSTQDVDLFVGYEFRRGRGRVQGFYGGEVGLGYGGGKAVYDYGNEMTELNQSPATTNFDGNLLATNRRVTEQKYGNEFRASLAGFVGVEYFFAPQISIGGELNLGLSYSILGQSERTIQAFDAASNEIQTFSERKRYSSDHAGTVGLRTITSGSIFLMFHF